MKEKTKVVMFGVVSVIFVIFFSFLIYKKLYPQKEILPDGDFGYPKSEKLAKIKEV